MEPDTRIETTYDSTPNTLAHIHEVSKLLRHIAKDLEQRSRVHDESKLIEPEKSIYDLVTPRLSNLTYGTQEYYDNLKDLEPALEHHYRVNDHHPEHFEAGIKGMNLLQIVEMFCDWYAASKRHEDGDIRKSIIHNEKRFNISVELSLIFLNTVTEFEKQQL